MIRISDGRMSGTGYGTVVLHIAPESAIGGTLGIVENGDIITLDIENRLLSVSLSDEEIKARKMRRQVLPYCPRGYVHLYQHHVEQAHLGADFDFLKGGSGSEVTKDSH